jgi:hypothetical protein
MKSFAALQYRGNSSHVKVEFDRPNVTKFVHELYKHSARKLWQVAYLFKGGPSEQQAKNRQEIEQIIHRTLDDVIRAFLPWEIIAKSYFTEVPEETPAPPPATKSVVFEDTPEEEEEEEEERPKSISLGDELDLSALELEEQEEEEKTIVVQKETPKELDALEEIESKVGEDTLVLNL